MEFRIENMEFKKARVAHTPKFDAKTTENTKNAKNTAKLQVPKILASGAVTHEPLFLAGSGSESPSSSAGGLGSSLSSSEEARTAQLGLRPRSKDCNYDENLISFKTIKDGLKHCDTLKRKRPTVTKRESVVTVSYEDVIEMISQHETENPPPKTFTRPCKNTLDWDFYIQRPENLQNVPPVTYFRNAPLLNIWIDIAKVGLSIELRNPFFEGSRDVFWLGTIVYFAGYKALVRFETFDDDCRNDYITWISFCSDVPRHLGWCVENGAELNPGPVVNKNMPVEVLARHLKEFMKRETIHPDHEERLHDAMRARRKLKPNVLVEVMDKDNLIQTRLGRISAIIGNRVHVAYYKENSNEDERDHSHGTRGLMYHYNSESLHPAGWSHTVGVELKGLNRPLQFPALPPEFFPAYPQDKIKIRVGMYLETRHPIKLFKIVGAVIIKVFKHGYFMIETREASKITRVKFIYHVTSPFVLHGGFAASHGIEVDVAPSDDSYMKNMLRVDLLPLKPSHNFRAGFKVEAIDLLDGCYCAPATVIKVAGHLLYLHFDNWRKDEERNYQWVDTEKSDIYPCGYREMMGIEWHGRLDDPFFPLEDD